MARSTVPAPVRSLSRGCAGNAECHPAPGWGFAGWGGACSGYRILQRYHDTRPDRSRLRSLPLYTLTVTITGNGSVTSTDGYINCPGMCSHTYLSNTPVTLNALAGPGLEREFMGWPAVLPATALCTV